MNTPALPETVRILHAAACLAARLHLHQLRKDDVTPYVSHLIRVPIILATQFGCDDPDILAAAILHDALEDTTADWDEIAETTSPAVADLVAALTKDPRIPEQGREEQYDRQLAAAPWQARLIKLADVYDNLTDSLLSGAKVEVADKVRRALALADGDPNLAPAAEALRALTRGVDSRSG